LLRRLRTSLVRLWKIGRQQQEHRARNVTEGRGHMLGPAKTRDLDRLVLERSMADPVLVGREYQSDTLPYRLHDHATDPVVVRLGIVRAYGLNVSVLRRERVSLSEQRDAIMQNDIPTPSSRADEEQMLRDIRSHLTVAMLAAQHLHRIHPNAMPVGHLFLHLHNAHQQLVRDIEQVEAMLRHRHDSHP